MKGLGLSSSLATIRSGLRVETVHYKTHAMQFIHLSILGHVIHSSWTDPKGGVAGLVHEDVGIRLLRMQDCGSCVLRNWQSYRIEQYNVSLNVPGGGREGGREVNMQWSGRGESLTLWAWLF